MRTRIDAAGRVVIPKPMRVQLGIDRPAEVDIEIRDGALEIRPPRLGVRLVTGDDGRPALQAPGGTPMMTDDDMFRAIDESREWPRRS